tara:strand:+ start:11509 stop:11850 length:342 start_codon:yes stop_codon:yes gene_type:complete
VLGRENAATRAENPPTVERETEDSAEAEADDVGRDVVGEQRREAENIVGDPEAEEADSHASDADDRKFDTLTRGTRAARCCERPSTIADPVRTDCECRGDHLGDHWALVEHVR